MLKSNAEISNSRIQQSPGLKIQVFGHEFHKTIPLYRRLSARSKLYELKDSETSGIDGIDGTAMTSSEQQQPSKPSMSKGTDDFAACILSQYRGCVAGVGLGAAYGIKYSKGALPMVAAGVAGSLADLAYGYFFACSRGVEHHLKSTKE